MLEEEVGVDPNTFRYRPFSRRGHKPLWFIFLIVVSAGLEPTHSEPKSDALPLGYETINEANMSKNFFFFFEVPIRFELMTPGYKAGILPNYTKEPNFWI